MINHPNILFIDSAHPCMKEVLEMNGFVCDDGTKMDVKEIHTIIHKYTGIIVRSRININKDFIDKATNLQFIGRVGAGMESIDIAYAQEKNVSCFNSPEGNRDAVGEQALGMLLSLMNNLNRADRQVRNGEWIREENRGFEIKGKTIAIIGYGNMGSSFARKLKGFEANVIAYDKYKQNYSDEFVQESSWNEIVEKADILSLHVPLTEETRYLINNSLIGKFKKDFWLINTARGPVVNTADLVLALKSGKIKGAALDVIEYEETSFESLSLKNMPAPWKYLVNNDKVILTPHIAGWTEESKEKLATVLAHKIIAFMKNNK
ncbi:MAG TPA: NAD(P)-dependent oxidoreductase [Bacteroidales bacterium]|nr:NAD(P)-dependent oxidoreductase [Bacteroidales bacterium]HQI45077.1 NAD(P)-dependent oxidoreductase [Bacteroidales bacterium]